MPTRNQKPEDLSSDLLLSQNFVNNAYVPTLLTSNTLGLKSFGSDIESFAHALRFDEAFFENNGGYASSPHLPGTPGSSYNTKIRKVSALSDFAPVNVKVNRRGLTAISQKRRINLSFFRRKRRLKGDKRTDYLFILLRWPLLVSKP